MRAGAAAALKLVHGAGIDADRQSRGLELPNGILEMRERRIRETAEIDHVGAGLAHLGRTAEDRVDRQGRCFDDLRKDAYVVPRQIGAVPAFAEIRWEILQFLGAALERHAEFGTQAREVRPAPAGQQDAAGVDWAWQPPGDDRFRHQRGDLHADVEDRPVEPRVGKSRKHFLEPRTREVAREEQDSLRHRLDAHPPAIG